MDNVREYIRLHKESKSDSELSRETGLEESEIAHMRREINRKLWMERTQKSKKRTGRF